MQDGALLKEIIIVDDGSTDNSVEIIKKYQDKYPIIKLYQQENMGQLAAIKRGTSKASGDIILFLDSDDRYLYPNYLNKLKSIYDKNEVDFVFCNALYYKEGFLCEKMKSFKNGVDTQFGYTQQLTSFIDCWLGAPTSCLSMTKNLANNILDIPDSFNQKWRIRADDILIHGASILGGKKYLFNSYEIGYLLHGNNGFAGKKLSKNEEELYVNNRNEVLQYYRSKSHTCFSLYKCFKEYIFSVELKELREKYHYIFSIHKKLNYLNYFYYQFSKIYKKRAKDYTNFRYERFIF